MNNINLTDDFIVSVKEEMLDWFRFDLTYEQVKNYLETEKLEYFETVEREDYAQFLAKSITGMEFPLNRDSIEYKETFYKKLSENLPESGYKMVV